MSGKCHVMYLKGNVSVERWDSGHLIPDTVFLYYTLKFEAGKFLHNRYHIPDLNGVTTHKVEI
jgi:hypothetical protein